MYRRFVHTMIGALAGYVIGAVVGMMLFAALNGFRSVAIVEEPNRNRWAFVAAAGAAVVGGLIAWWRSYDQPTLRARPDADDETSDTDGAGPPPAPGAPPGEASVTSGGVPEAPATVEPGPPTTAGPPVADGTADGGSAAP